MTTLITRSVFCSFPAGMLRNAKPTSNIANSMSSTWLKSKAVNSEKAKIISNTLVRASAVTYLYKAGLIDNMEEFANSFMKHKTSTSQKHYLVKHFATQTTMKYSMGLHNLFGNNTYSSERKLEEMSASIKKVPEANFDAVLTYIKNLFSVLPAESSESYSDDNLLRCLSGKMILGERKKVQASGMIDNVDEDDEDSNLAMLRTTTMIMMIINGR